jgi:hypothetical protein
LYLLISVEEILQMIQNRIPLFLLASALSLAGCQQQAQEPSVDMTALRQEVLKKTQDLYRIHLRLDSTASDITAAELKARNAECSDAEYLAADAYRNLEEADQAVLQLGRELQALFNLDAEMANSP